MGQGGSGFASNRPFGSSVRAFGEINGVYDTAFTPVSVDSSGRIPSTGAYGLEGGVGLFGEKSWRQALVGIAYRGNYRHYPNNPFFNGSDHFADIMLTRQVGRRTSLGAQIVGGTSSRTVGGIIPGFTDTGVISLPVNEFFDNRIYFGDASVRVTHQLTHRFGVTAGAGAFTTRRRSTALAGVDGYQTRGGFFYRLSRMSTLGIDYGYQRFTYRRFFGEASGQSLGLVYNRRLDRVWDFNIRGGAFLVDVTGLQRIQIDPVIAALVGQSSSINVFNRRLTFWMGDLMLSRTFRRASTFVGFMHGLNPGNGLWLASRSTSASTGYTYARNSRWNVTTLASYMEFSALAQDLGRFRSAQVSVASSYQIGEKLYLTPRFDYRRALTSGNFFRRDAFRVSLGLAYSPGVVPFDVW